MFSKHQMPHCPVSGVGARVPIPELQSLNTGLLLVSCHEILWLVALGLRGLPPHCSYSLSPASNPSVKKTFRCPRRDPRPVVMSQTLCSEFLCTDLRSPPRMWLQRARESSKCHHLVSATLPPLSKFLCKWHQYYKTIAPARQPCLPNI